MNSSTNNHIVKRTQHTLFIQDNPLQPCKIILQNAYLSVNNTDEWYLLWTPADNHIGDRRKLRYPISPSRWGSSHFLDFFIERTLFPEQPFKRSIFNQTFKHNPGFARHIRNFLPLSPGLPETISTAESFKKLDWSSFIWDSKNLSSIAKLAIQLKLVGR